MPEPAPERTPPDDTTEGLREQIKAALRSTWDGAPTVMEDAIHEESAAVLAVVSPVLERQRLAYNGANAMMGVHKRRADNLRRELDHAKAALAGDNEGVRLFMADCERRVERLKEQAELSAKGEQDAEAEVERLRAERDEALKRKQWAIDQADKQFRARRDAEAERDALKAAIERLMADRVRTEHFACRPHRCGDEASDMDGKERCHGCRRVWPCPTIAALDAPETTQSGDWLKNLADVSLAAAREKFGPTSAPETPEGDSSAWQNAQDWHEVAQAREAAIERVRERLDWLIANGFGARTDTLSELRAALDAPETPGDAEAGQRHEPPSPIYCRAEHPFGEHNEDTHICQGFPAHPDFGLGHACRCGFKWPAHSSGDAG